MIPEEVEGPGGPSLGTRTLRGTAWALGSHVGGQVLVLISTAILARLLGPEAFGLVALALVFITLLDTVSDLGLSPALVISREDELEERANTAFGFTVLLGVLLSALTAATGPFAAAFFDQPELTPMLAVLGITFFLRSLGATHYALAQKHMDFRSRTSAELAGVVTRGAASIALALAGLGAWSLVLGYLVGTTVQTLVLWVLVPWRPSGRPSRKQLPSMLRFGSALTGVDVLAAVISQVDYVFVGRVLGAQAVGLYTLGFRLPEVLVIALPVVVGRVLFPAFAAVEREGLGRAFLVSQRYAMILAVPLATGLAVLAEPLVAAVFGPEWSGAVASMQVLSIYGLCVAIGIPSGVAFKATGKAGILLALAVPRAALVVGSIALVVHEGIVAVATCQAVVAALFAGIGLVIAARLLGVAVSQVLGTLMPPVVAAAGMGTVAFVLAEAIASPWLALAAGVPAGAAVYAGLLWLIAPEWLRDLRRRLAAMIQAR